MKMTTRAGHSAVVLALGLGAASAAAQWPFPLYDDTKPTLAPLLEQVTPAVVNISVSVQSRGAPNPLLQDPFFSRFFDTSHQPRRQPRQAAGSGVIVDAERGHILTNQPVFNGAHRISVTRPDRRSFEAKLLGSDAGTDIALLEIEAEYIDSHDLGDSEALKVGDFVLAIGNPFGFGQTVTSSKSAIALSDLRDGMRPFIVVQ